jgi:RNA polymerase-interacting CarD/CdnL/TRCF family regulator
MSAKLLGAGERVFHPVYGFGVIEGLIMRDQSGQNTEFYTVRLSDGGVLTVPVSRAESLGLRPIANSLSSIVKCLRSPAQPLPDNDRQRFVELQTRWRTPKPAALAQAVRDLWCRSRTRSLTPADKRWLANACDTLSTEAALVDSIDQEKARAVIQQELDGLKSSVPAALAPNHPNHKRNRNK